LVGREDAPLLFRPRAELGEWIWRFVSSASVCPASRSNTEAAFALALYAEQLTQLRRDTR